MAPKTLHTFAQKQKDEMENETKIYIYILVSTHQMQRKHGLATVDGGLATPFSWLQYWTHIHFRWSKMKN